jgi:hypothetical protein
MGHLAHHLVILLASLGGLAFFQWFDWLPLPSWGVGL